MIILSRYIWVLHKEAEPRELGYGYPLRGLSRLTAGLIAIG